MLTYHQEAPAEWFSIKILSKVRCVHSKKCTKLCWMADILVEGAMSKKYFLIMSKWMVLVEVNCLYTPLLSARKLCYYCFSSYLGCGACCSARALRNIVIYIYIYMIWINYWLYLSKRKWNFNFESHVNKGLQEYNIAMTLCKTTVTPVH